MDKAIREDSHLNFSWDKLGDITKGRPNLGTDVPVAVYRLYEYAMSDILAHEFGPEKAAELMRRSGMKAGREFATNVLDLSLDIKGFLAQLAEKMLALRIGVLRVEQTDIVQGTFTVTVSEDLDCSGLPPTGETVCTYDEGLLEGIFAAYAKADFTVREVDCWATGAKTCRFKGSRC
jgi:predicted hydrocarbon binding protein